MNKTKNIKQKIIDGKIRKFKSENSLLEQDFIKNPELKVKDLIKDNEQEIQKITDNNIDRLNSLQDDKEKEILEV